MREGRPTGTRRPPKNHAQKLAQKSAPLITKTVDIARNRVYKLQQLHQRGPRDSDLQKKVNFVQGDSLPGSEMQVDSEQPRVFPEPHKPIE